MRYVSTRGSAPVLDFAEVTLAGLADDGGLYVPETWPTLPATQIAELAGLPYAELAARIMRPFVGDCLTPERLRALTGEAYARFAHAAVTPLKQLERGLWTLELFHGPTLAFKDVALQLLGLFFERFLKGMPKKHADDGSWPRKLTRWREPGSSAISSWTPRAGSPAQAARRRRT